MNCRLPIADCPSNTLSRDRQAARSSAKSEFRNPKSETISNTKIKMTETAGARLSFHLSNIRALNLPALSLSNGFRVSNFGFRISRKGFSFTEILFAVMILGIGFIMIAAMFPVAIKQTENSQQETIGAAVARAAVDHLQQFAQQTYISNQDGSL